MATNVDLPQFSPAELPRHLRIKYLDDGMRVSFRYASPRVAILIEKLFKLMGLLVSACFFADLLQAYTAGSELFHRNLAERYILWVYAVYELPKPLIEWFVFGYEDRIGPSISFMFVSLGAFLTWGFGGRLLTSAQLSPDIYTALFGLRKRITITHDHITIGRAAFPMDGRQTFALTVPEALQNNMRVHPTYERASQLNFVNGVNQTPVVTIYGKKRAQDIQNGLHYVLQHFA